MPDSKRLTDSKVVTKLRDGEARLVAVLGEVILAHTPDVSLSHAEFVRRSLGELPQGAWVGTIRRSAGEVVAVNSRTFYGNQLPAPANVTEVIRIAFE